MSYIRIIEINSALDPDLLSATLYTAEIDDVTGAIVQPPQRKAQGRLNIQTLVDLNQQVINNFQNRTSGHQYFSSIQLPDNMICSSGDPIDRLKLDIENLQVLLNRTLSQSSWRDIRDALLNSLSHIDLSKTVRLIIRTNDINLQSLPIEGTSFITSVLTTNGRKVSVIFDPENGSKMSVWQNCPRILLVFGSQKGIESPLTENDVASYFPSHAIVTTLIHPSRDLLVNTISDRSFDAVFIIAHSRQEDNGIDGRIDINDDGDSISINDWTEPFQHSVNRGLKLVVLAGCASVGLARSLASNPIGVSNVVSFRMPVHHQTLRHFIDRLLTNWITEAKSLEIAVSETRIALTVHNPKFPGGLPILFSSAYDSPLMFPIASPERGDDLIAPGSLGRRILANIKKIKPKKITLWLMILLAGFAIAIGLHLLLRPQLESTCNSIINDRISCGEEPLNQEREVAVQGAKQAGADAIASGDYPQAIKSLTTAWAAKKDPETLIMLENSKLRTQTLPIKTIALTIPASQSTPIDIPNSMLKGVGYAQQQWNANPNHKWNLQLVLADDRNKESTVRDLASNLLKREIIAGIGSYSSAVTIPMTKVYEKQQTVLISGTSTATKLANSNPNNLFFRICASNKVSGKQMAEYLQKHKYSKIAIFHTSGQPFSDSMTDALKENILNTVQIVNDFDFTGTSPAIDKIKAAKQAGALALVLIPDAYTSDNPERDRLLSIIKANNGDLPIIGNEVVKDATLFNYSNKQIEKIVISLPWHPSSNQHNKAIEIPDFWGDGNQLDHRIAMNYDAAQVLIKALDMLPINQSVIDSRLQIQKIISSDQFSIDGITGSIGFNGSERSQPSNSLVTPKCDDTKCSGFKPAT